MISIIQRNEVLKLRDEGLTYDEIGTKLNLKWYSVRNICIYKRKSIKKKTGPKRKITKPQGLMMKRRIVLMKEQCERVTSPKIIKECQLNANVRTVQKYLRSKGYKYRKISKQICLTKNHKRLRILSITDWITNCQNWERTVFSDEKRFCLDGPDDWRSYYSKNTNLVRQRRQCNGGGIMVWLMIMPNCLLSYKIIHGNFNSVGYIKLLSESIVPIIKLNFGLDIWYQEDNSPVHKAKKVQQFLKDAQIRVLEWPPKSPDLNIVEDVWRIVSERVYDGPQYKNNLELGKKINQVINELNHNGKQLLWNLYGQIRGRLCKVLQRKGNLYNKNCKNQ